MALTLNELLADEVNRDRFERLHACVERGDLIPFVGAGMSRDNGYPLWSDFIRDMGERAQIRNDVEASLRTGDYEGALGKVHARLDEKLTRKEIKRRFGPSRLDKERLRGAVLHLPALAHGPVITTNYDCVLESVFHHASRAFHKVVIGGRRDAVYSALFEKQPYLLKIHGTYDEADGQLVTRADYDVHYGNKVDGKFDPDLVLPTLLHRIFGSRPLLFLGCSLTADRIMALLDYMYLNPRDAPAEHFAIVPREATPEATLERERFLVNHHIEPIFYPPGEHGVVEIFLAALAGPRTNLVEEVLVYLDTMAKDAAKLPSYYPAHLRPKSEETRFDAIRQRVQVVEDRSAFEQWLAEERERMRAAGQEVERLAYAPRRASFEAEENEREVRRMECPAPPPPIPWDERAGERFQHAVILGDPGFGKTWLLRYEARRLAREGAQQLDECRISLDGLLLPIFAHLSDMNRYDDPLEETLIAVVGAGRSDAFRRFVREKLATDRCVILLDAWDEVPVEVPKDGQLIHYAAGFRQRLGQRLEAFARQFPKPRLLMTSRIVGYIASPIPEAKELELLAFDAPEIEAFVRVWFGSDTGTAAQFLTMLRQNPQVQGLGRIPLMLALMCRVYQERQLAFPTRRVELYDRCLRGLLREWKEEKQRRQISDVRLTNTLSRLARGAFQLHLKQMEQFTEVELAEALGFNLESNTEAEEAEKFVESLKCDDIFITADERHDAPLLFLHRTFHEYLTAGALAQRKDWVEVALSYVYDPGWSEVLRLLGGLLGERTPVYIAALLRENAEDLLCRPLWLGVFASAEASPIALSSHFSERLIQQTVNLYLHAPGWFGYKHFLPLVSVWGDRFVPCLLHQLENTDWRARQAAAEALGQIGSAAAVSALLRLLRNADGGVRQAAAFVLGQIGSVEAIPALLRLLEDEVPCVRRLATEALGRIRSAEAVPALVRSLEDADWQVRRLAAEALGQIGSVEAIPALVRLLTDINLMR